MPYSQASEKTFIISFGLASVVNLGTLISVSFQLFNVFCHFSASDLTIGSSHLMTSCLLQTSDKINFNGRMAGDMIPRGSNIVAMKANMFLLVIIFGLNELKGIIKVSLST